MKEAYPKWGLYRLIHTMKVAALLAEDGAFPGPMTSEHGRRREFIKLCQKTLLDLAPTAETDPQKMSWDDAKAVRLIMQGEDAPDPYEGCYTTECMGKEPSWGEPEIVHHPDGVQQIEITKCTRCFMPMAWGRTIHSLLDTLDHRQERIDVDLFRAGRI